MPFNLRHYQREAADSTEFSWCENTRVVGNLGTGGGKTVIAAETITRSKGMRVAFVADQNELCEQSLRVIRAHSGIVAGLDKAKHQAPLTSSVVVASAQTWVKEDRLMRFPENHFQRIIIDEVHRSTFQKMDMVDKRHPNAEVIGITATAFRKNMRDLSKWFSDTAFHMPLYDPTGRCLDLVGNGFAPPMIATAIDVKINLKDVGSSMIGGEKDYKLSDLDTAILPYYNAIAKELVAILSGRKYHLLVFLPLVKSSIEFVAILGAHGISARHVDGKSKDRSQIIESFAQGDFSVLCNAELCSTGVDIPIADAILDLSPTCSLNKLQQRYGRIMRVLPGVVDDLPEANQAEERKARIAASAKPNVLAIEAIYQGDSLGSVHAGHLIARDEDEAKAIYERIKKERTPEEIAETARRVQAEKEERLVKAIEDQAARKSSYDPAQIGYLLGNPRIADYDGVRAWEVEAPSEKQLNYLKYLGADVSQVKFKGLASMMIDQLSFRRKSGYASLAQIATLKQIGMPNPEKLTFREAALIIGGKSKRHEPALV